MVWEVQYDCLQPGELAEVHGHELQGHHQRGRAISSSFATRCRAEWAEGWVAQSTDPHWPGLSLLFYSWIIWDISLSSLNSKDETFKKCILAEIIVSIRKKVRKNNKVRKSRFGEVFVMAHSVVMTHYNPISYPQNKMQRKGTRQEAIWPRSTARASSKVYPLGNHQWKWGEVWWWDTGTGADGKMLA